MKNGIRRGVIEGFYGHPWSPRQRERMVDLLAQWELDTFLCSPKDQPNHRIYWQEPFGEAAIAQLKILVDRGKNIGVDVGTSLSPGLTLEYSNPQHLDSQLHRLSQLSAIGCNLVGIFLDDIPGELQTDKDKKMFSTIVEAQLHFTNSLYERSCSQGLGMEFIVCPTQYYGIGNEESISTFGSGLNRDQKLMWTGRQICSPTLTYADAQILERGTGHKPFYWDNYPVNDVAMTYQLHIGPLRGREPAMLENMSGYLANPMELFESSLIPLRTMADFFSDPHAYDPDRAWDAVVEKTFAISSERDAFRHFGRTVHDSCLNGDASPDVSMVLNRAAFLWRTAESSSACDLLKNLSTEIAMNSQTLLSPDFTLKDLQSEIHPWVVKYELGGRAIGYLAQMLGENPNFDDINRNQQNAKKLTQILDEIHENRYRVYGDHLEMLLSDLIDELNWASERIEK
ncbi:MAG: beta-N-acetylglucosaminidase domain-containing protein [Actinomycetes bacterium]|jgi:hyaluronoglucosaminidase